MLKRIIVSLLIGILLVLSFAPYDPWVRQHIGAKFKQAFESSIGCRITFDVENVNFLMPTLVLKNVLVGSKDLNDTSWHWRAHEYKVGFSWMHLIGLGSIDMWIQLDELKIVTSCANDSLAITPHIQQLMVPPSWQIPLVLKTLRLRKSELHITDSASNLDFKMHWSSESRKVGDQFKTRLYIADAHCALQDRIVFKQGNGNVLIDIEERQNNNDIVFRIDTRMHVPHLANSSLCFFSGTWRNDYGRFSLANAHDTLRVDPIIITRRNNARWLNIQARLPLSCCWRFACNDTKVNGVSGACIVRMQGALHKKGVLHGHVVFDDIRYKNNNWRLGAKSNFVRERGVWRGDVQLHMPSVTELDGSWRWDEHQENGNLSLANTSAIPIPRAPYWRINPRNFNLKLSARGIDVVTGSYSCTAHSTVLSDAIQSDGRIDYDAKDVSLCGTLNSQPYECVSELQFPYLHHVFYGKPTDKSYLSVVRSPKMDTGFLGAVSVGFMRTLVAQLFDYDVQGEGMAHVDAFIEDSKVKTRIRLDDTVIRLPQTYNFINGLHAHIDYDHAERQLRIHDAQCTMHAGVISTRHAVCAFDDAWHLSFVHTPILFDRCLLNIKKDLFTQISGHALFEKRGSEQPLLKGRLIVDRAQLKENLLSEALQQKVRSFTGDMFDVKGSDIRCDFGIETRDVVRVDTPFLQANAAVNMHIGNSILNPDLSGSISLLSGALRFPYKPLYITKGEISFVAGQQRDPLINLVARNKIKQHNVALHVTGSLLNHHMVLESTPPLADEQIIALLLVGSHDQSLNSMMPALIMQNLRHLIFDATQSSFFERYLMPFDKSFKISLVPSFTDQTGRGGLRGAIEIDVNDCWRAMIQKNFSLTEDTRVEIEYLFSDDVTVRAIRDERRDLGAEIEMRWKF